MNTGAKEALIRTVKSFDICSLLKALHYLGYGWDDIFFKGIAHHTSNSSLCHEIAFGEKVYPKVTLTLNLGLLSSCSLLPSFFYQAIDKDSVGGERFLRFLNFFNHYLIKEFLKTSLIEENTQLFPNWSETQRDYFSLLGLDTLSTVTFLIQIVFPEFDVVITKNLKSIKLEEFAFFLGKGGIGEDAILGGNVSKTFASFKAILFIDEELSDLLIPWPIEIRKRLKTVVFPLLQRVDIHLTVLLVIRNKKSQMTLSQGSYLGFERVGNSPHPFELMIFHGHVKNLAHF